MILSDFVRFSIHSQDGCIKLQIYSLSITFGFFIHHNSDFFILGMVRLKVVHNVTKNYVTVVHPLFNIMYRKWPFQDTI